MPIKTSAGLSVIHNLQILRAIAAGMVVFVHFDQLFQNIGLPPFNGGGVDIFFVISGFIMVYTTTNRADVTPFSFMADRITRIVPVYWALTFAAFGIALLFPTLFEETRANWNELIKSLLFIPFVKSGGTVAPLLFVGWTLNYEMFFYLLFALGLALRNRTLGAAAVIVSLICLAVIGRMHLTLGVMMQFYTSMVMLSFVSGMIIGLLHRRIPPTAPLSLKMVVAVTALTALGAVSVLPSIFPDTPSFIVCGLPATLLVGGAVALERWGWVVYARWCLLLGNASYAIYLVHPFLAQAAQKLAAKWPVNAEVSVMFIVTALAGSFVAGIITHQFVERPLSRMCRRLLKVRRLNPRMDGQVPAEAFAVPSMEHSTGTIH